uniref:Elongator complex protein 5 n=1 Tax=Anopheles atroparvus TaxID=41427 RepID=A0AAG5D902_ANOAO
MSFARRNNNRQSKTAEMLSSLAFTQQKVIVVNDKIGFEPHSKLLIEQWITEQRGGTFEACEVESFKESSPFLMMSISKLERRVEPRQLFGFVAQCKQNSAVTHLCIWVSEHKLKRSFLLPYLEHMADTVITFEDNQHVALLVKKSSGSVSNKYYTFEAPPPSKTIYVTEVIRTAQTRETSAPAPVESPPNPATLGTFKIDLKDEEIKAKNALTLPFEFFKSTPEGGKILYHPDAEDDLDEEDPDNDLLI